MNVNAELLRQKVAKLTNDVKHVFEVLYGRPPVEDKPAVPGFGHFLTEHHERIAVLERTCAALFERNRTLEDALGKQFLLVHDARWNILTEAPPFHSTLQAVRTVRYDVQPSQDAPACPSGPGPRSPSSASASPGSSSTTVDSPPTTTR